MITKEDYIKLKQHPLTKLDAKTSTEQQIFEFDYAWSSVWALFIGPMEGRTNREQWVN